MRIYRDIHKSTCTHTHTQSCGQSLFWGGKCATHTHTHTHAHTHSAHAHTHTHTSTYTESLKRVVLEEKLGCGDSVHEIELYQQTLSQYFPSLVNCPRCFF